MERSQQTNIGGLTIIFFIVAIAISFASFGHLTGYASKIMEQQQKRLRQQYGLAPEHIVTDPKILQVPPSLREMLSAYYNDSK